MIFTILGLINMILEKLSQSNIFLSLTLVQMKLENLFLTIKPTANQVHWYQHPGTSVT